MSVAGGVSGPRGLVVRMCLSRVGSQDCLELLARRTTTSLPGRAVSGHVHASKHGCCSLLECSLLECLLESAASCAPPVDQDYVVYNYLQVLRPACAHLAKATLFTALCKCCDLHALFSLCIRHLHIVVSNENLLALQGYWHKHHSMGNSIE